MTGRLPLGLLLGASALSCTPQSRPTPAQPPRPTAAIDACALSTDSAPMPDTLTLALSGSVDPAHAPVPVIDAERMAFRQLYETLVRLDCAGVPQPALAASWTSGESGRRWTFTLR